MKRPDVLLAAAAALLLGVAASDIAQARGAPAGVRQAGLPEGEGRAVVEKLCGACHGLDYLVPSQRTVQTWREIIDLMRGYGAEATDEQWTTITDYIVGTLAYLNANKATAEEYSLFFRIDGKAGQAVTAYREKQGGFKTADDLKKAPGLDAARIDAVQERLVFE